MGGAALAAPGEAWRGAHGQGIPWVRQQSFIPEQSRESPQ